MSDPLAYGTSDDTVVKMRTPVRLSLTTGAVVVAVVSCVSSAQASQVAPQDTHTAALQRAAAVGALLGSEEVTAASVALVVESYGPAQSALPTTDLVSAGGDVEGETETSVGVETTPVEDEPVTPEGSTPAGTAPSSDAPPAMPTPDPVPTFEMAAPSSPLASNDTLVPVPKGKGSVTYVLGGVPGQFTPGYLGMPGGVVSVDGKVCPVPGATFSDTYGAARSGGRSHQGADMFASEGAPILAVSDAVISRVDPTDVGGGDLGGITISYVTTSGDRWYNAHLVTLAPGMREGLSVKAGDVVGYVGRSGNARTTPPHNHIELHPAGGVAVNPTVLLKSLCG